MSDELEEARATVASVRARLDRAQPHQVELHLDLGTVELLVALAEAALGAYQRREGGA